MRILFIGDIVGRLGRETVKKVLPTLKNRDNIDLVLANAENLAGGRGATEETVLELLQGGVDFFTSGDHIFWYEEFVEKLDKLSVLRPANYPKDVGGRGYTVLDLGRKGQVLLINLSGKEQMRGPVLCPFRTVDEILEQFKDKDLVAVVVDFHAEITSEKKALGFYLDGRVSAVLGTHTHVPSADARILPLGTAFVTDVGMVGAWDSVLGVEPKIIIERLKRPPCSRRFEWVKKGPSVFNSVLIEVGKDKKAKSIKRIDRVKAKFA